MLEKATMADFAELCRLYEAVCGAMEATGLRQWHWGRYPAPQDVEEDLRQGWLYVYREEGEILCAMAVNQEQDPLYADIPWRYAGTPGLFHRVAVSPAAQGKGLARRALHEVEDILRAQGCTVLRGDTFSLNRNALRLYERLGMEKAGELHFAGFAEPFIALEKKL